MSARTCSARQDTVRVFLALVAVAGVTSLGLCVGCASGPNVITPTTSASAPAIETATTTVEPTASATPLAPAAEQTPTVPAVAATESAAPPVAKPPATDVARVLADTKAIVDFGVRKGGSRAERRAFDYILRRLRDLGYEPRTESFALPDGSTSRNIIVVVPGSDPRVVSVGAHIDSKPPAPGANDSAVACGLLLEYARLLKDNPAVPTVELDFFGAEEYVDSVPGHHHYGSRHRVASMSKKERRNLVGMISVDVIGVGENLHTRTMGVGPKAMSDLVLKEARRQGVHMTYLRDPGSTGWSDHEPYERAGYPAVWVERLTDPAYHTSRDITTHLQKSRVKETAKVVLGVVRALDHKKLDALEAAREN